MLYNMFEVNLLETLMMDFGKDLQSELFLLPINSSMKQKKKEQNSFESLLIPLNIKYLLFITILIEMVMLVKYQTILK